MQTRLKRKRATAIVETSEGILITMMRYMACSLPGGGVHPGESDEDAVVRELFEETGLVSEQTTFLFRYETLAHEHMVFWIKAHGTPEPGHEVDQLAYYRAGVSLNLSPETKKILDYFSRYKAAHPDLFEALAAAETDRQIEHAG